MQSMPDGQNRFVMNYQDHRTNFCVKEPLTSKRAAEVAYKLPNSVFLVKILEFKQLRPKIVIVHGRPRHPKSQESIKRSNDDIHDMLFR